jgi:hypothetical protein
MEDLFTFVREKTIKILIEQSQSFDVIRKNINIKKIDEIKKLENLRQLISFIDNRLLSSHKLLKKKGVNHKRIKTNIILNGGSRKLKDFLSEEKISIDEIYDILILDYKNCRKYLKENYGDLAEILAQDKNYPFKRKLGKKVKSNSSKQIRLIYTPMGNKMR